MLDYRLIKTSLQTYIYIPIPKNCYRGNSAEELLSAIEKCKQTDAHYSQLYRGVCVLFRAKMSIMMRIYRFVFVFLHFSFRNSHN